MKFIHKLITKTLLVIVLMLLFTGCYPCQKITNITQRDSVSIELKSRIVTIHDTVVINVPLTSQSVIVHTDSSFLSNDFAYSNAIIRPSGELYHTLESIPQSLQTEYISKVEVRDSIIYRDRIEVQTIEVARELSWWQEFQIRGFRLLVLILVGAIVVKKLLG